MKKQNLKILAIVSLAIIIGFTIFSFAAPVVKVVVPAKDKKDTIHLKIKKEINGKITEIDTTIYSDGNFDIDGFLSSKGMPINKEINLTINMDSIMTVVHQSLENIPDMDSIMTVVCKSIKGINMDSIETIIHQGMKEMPDMDSIMTILETGMKECSKTIKVIKCDSLGPNCSIYIDGKELKNNPTETKIIKDGNKTIIIKCDKSNGSDSLNLNCCFNIGDNDPINKPKGTKMIKDGNNTIIIKCDKNDGNVTMTSDKSCKNPHTIVCKVIIEDTGEKDKSIIKESNNSKEALKVDKLNFFPNPSTGKFNLSFSTENKGKTEITILDANGKEVYKENISDFNGTYSKEIDISQNPKGAYFLIVKQAKKVMTKKLVIQ